MDDTVKAEYNKVQRTCKIASLCAACVITEAPDITNSCHATSLHPECWLWRNSLTLICCIQSSPWPDVKYRSTHCDSVLLQSWKWWAIIESKVLPHGILKCSSLYSFWHSFSLVMQILCFTPLFCLKTALAFVLPTCHHGQSFNRSHHYGDIADKAAETALICLYWAVLERTGLSVWYTCSLATQSFLWCSVPVRGLPSSAPRRKVKRRLSRQITNRLCFAFWHPKHLWLQLCSNYI